MERSEAIALGLTHYNTGRPCKHGHIEARRVKDRVCMECDRLHQSKLHYADLEKSREYARAQYIKHREKNLANKRAYRQNNKGKVNALVAARKKHVRLRTPKWVGKEDRWLIRQAYELAEIRTKLFNYAWHVDHIIPLQGSTVSGLHIVDNLRVIPAVENIRKKNLYAE